MDPLSITASIITLVGVVGATSKGLQKLTSIKKGSDVVYVLINEVSDFEIVLHSLNAVVRQRRLISTAPTSVTETLVKVVGRSEDLMNRITKLTDKCLKDHGNEHSPRPKISRMTWLRQQSSLKSLQEELRTLKQNLSTLLSVAICDDVLRIELRLDTISASIAPETRNQSSVNHDPTKELVDSKRGSSIIDPGSLSLHNRVNDTKSQQANLFTESFINKTTGTILENLAPVAIIAESRLPMRVTSTQFLSPACLASCQCQCHKRSRHRTPRVFDWFIGALFFEYIGRPHQLGRCISTCRRPKGGSVRVTHFFPHWFCMTKIAIVLSQSTRGVSFTLNASRQISPKSQVFEFCRSGNLAAIKDLFSSNLASPFDVSAQTGSTLLTHAVMGCQSGVCRFLINAGADPFAMNIYGRRPIDDVLDLVLTSRLESAIFEQYFIDGDFYDEKDFSIVHKAATGIFPLDMATILSASDVGVDTKDSDGRTPLAWAAGLDNLDTVEKLLAYGADPNSIDNLQAVPLFAAVKSSNLAIVRLLLLHGANVNAKDHWYNTPLHVAALRRREVDMTLELVAAGAELDVKDRAGWTPLCAAIFWDHVPVVKALIDLGADIETLDHDGLTPLFQSVWQNQPRSAMLLLESGSRTSGMTKNGRTLLHIAAEFAGIDLLQILQANIYPSIDTEIRDSAHRTARMTFERRSDMTPSLSAAFNELLAAMYVQDLGEALTNNSSIGSFKTGPSTASIEIWEDAKENLQVGSYLDLSKRSKMEKKKKKMRLSNFLAQQDPEVAS